MGRVVELDDLVREIDKVRGSKTIVHCHGVYDLLHPGHINHLNQARKLGDILVVTVTGDGFVNKGPGRPIISAVDRAEMLAALGIVDYVAISNHGNSVEIISKIRPAFYVKGSDYKTPESDITGNIRLEKEAVEHLGGKLHFTDGRTMSSSSLINLLNSENETSYAEWLRGFRQKYTAEQLDNWLLSASKLKVLVIGEAILDDYYSCEALGKSSKDPVLAFRKISYERQMGGSLAIARNASGIANRVSVMFRSNKTTRDLDYIRQNLPAEIQTLSIESENEPTIVKTRYIDSLTGNKVFETYTMNEDLIDQSDKTRTLAKIVNVIENFDLVVVADYGHGLLDGDSIEAICKKAKFLAVNTQSNAGNRGFNSISKYKKMSFACLNGAEVSLEIRQRHLTVEALVPELLTRTGANIAMVTNGAKGVAYADKTNGTGVAPGFATKVNDRVGAGDALFVVSALLLAAGAPTEVAATFGNLAGAISIADLGNRASVDRVTLHRHALALLK